MTFLNLFAKKRTVNSKSVAIVGAGVAGLSAARELKRLGHTVKVFEARDRAGGRVWTDNKLGTPVDMGAAWIHGNSGNPVFKLCRQHKIPTAKTDYAEATLIDECGKEASPLDKVAFAARANRLLPRLKRLARTLESDITVKEAVRLLAEKQSLGKMELPFLNRQLIELEAYNGASLEELSLHNILIAAEHRHGDDLLFPGGQAQWIDVLARDTDIVFNAPVKAIKQNPNEVVIQMNDSEFVGDAAVVTLPLGVLKAKRIEFYPELSQEKQNAIERIKMGSFNKIAMRFDEPYWGTTSDFIELIPTNHNQTIQLLSLYRYTNEAIIVVCVAANTSRQWENLSDKEITEKALKFLRQLYGETVKDPLLVSISRWGKDEYSLGAYSILNPEAKHTDFESLSKSEGRFFFAGEATCFEYQGTIHGAYNSGIRAAKELHHHFS